MATCYPLKPCAHPGCHEFAVRGESYCAKHLKEREALRLVRERLKNSKRPNAYRRGYTARWAKARDAYLTEHPLCAECLRHGKITAATEVDHIIPHRGDKNLFWAVSNWQALCHECHSRKTATEDGGFGNRTPRGELKNKICG